MKPNFRTRLSLALIALTVTGSALLFNACQKDASGKTASLQTTNAQTSATAAKAAFDATMDSLAKKSLVAWYSFDSGSLMDKSKHNNDIIFSNATPATDRYGNEGYAYKFDGSSSYMEVKDSRSLNPTQEITLFAIVKVDDFYGGPCHGNRIFCKGGDDFGNGHYFLSFDDGYHTDGMNCSQGVKKGQENFNATYGFAGAGQSAGAYDTGYVHRDKWYRLAFTYANGVSKMYVNGRLMTYTIDHSVAFRDNKQNLFIGRMGNDQYPYWFNGVIDEVAIFYKALSDDEVASLSKL